MVHWSGAMALGDGAVAETAVRIAEAKVALPFAAAFFRGLLCNTLVCLAVWLCFAAHDVASKILAIAFPISAFVALGFEHTLPTNVAEGSIILAAVLLGYLLPVTAAQILWINMITTVTLGLALAFEPAEQDVMARPPRPPDEPLLSGFWSGASCS